MSRWFRFYEGTLDDPKIIKLPDDLFRAWVSLLCVASKNGGRLPLNDDVAIMLRTTVSSVEKIIAELVSRNLLDEVRGGGVEPHNWRKRQYKSDVSTDRVKRFRKRFKAVSETPPETEQNTDTEQKEYGADAPQSDDWPKDFRERFWEAYPRKVGKHGALQELARVRRKSVSFEKLISAVRAYAATADPNFTKHPQTWLSKGCWDDEFTKPQSIPTLPTITPADRSWNAWKSHFRDTGQNGRAAIMDKCATDGKPFTVQSEWPQDQGIPEEGDRVNG